MTTVNLPLSLYTAKQAFKWGPSFQCCLESSVMYRLELRLCTGTVCVQVPSVDILYFTFVNGNLNLEIV